MDPSDVRSRITLDPANVAEPVFPEAATIFVVQDSARGRLDKVFSLPFWEGWTSVLSVRSEADWMPGEGKNPWNRIVF